MYVGTDDIARVVNWRTGEITETDAIAPGYPEVFGGRAESDGRIVDATTGKTLLEVDADDSYVSLSPDGRYASVSSYDERPAGRRLRRRLRITGRDRLREATATDWSQDGQLFADRRP